MKTYEITATRGSDGGEVKDRFTEATEGAARKAFKEVYRHDNYNITNVEVVNDNAQASKDQERKALAEIQKIIDNLGPDSYIGTAFKGVAQTAEWNIENDGADSLYDQLELAKEREKEYRDKATEYIAKADKVNEAIAQLDEALKNAQAKAIPEYLYKWLYVLVTDEQLKCNESIMVNATLIAKNDDESGVRTRSLERLPHLVERKEHLEQIFTALEAIEPEGI